MSYDSALYIHELDKRAFNAMNAFPKLVKLREAYLANVNETAEKIYFLSNAIRISDRQFPKVYELLPPICDKLGIDIPDIYYCQSKHMNAFTAGNTIPFICVTSRLVNELPSELISSTLAHECGHIACKHYLYHSIAVQLIDGIERSPLSLIPAIRKYLTPALEQALMFWYRCSELSADRAAVLCDGNSDNLVELILRINNYKNINREEFLRQAEDLNAFVNESGSNKLIELMMIKNDSHPGLAARAYECSKWAKSEQFLGILNGTYAINDRQKAEEKTEEQEIISAEVSVETESGDLDEINAKLDKINADLERYTVKADKTDYAFAVLSGILAGVIDSIFVGEFNLEDADRWGNEKAKDFVIKVAQKQGYNGNTLPGAIKHLEDMFPIAADKVTSQFGGGLQHHLRDFSHHPTPVGLVCSILTQFTKNVYGTDKNGAFQKIKLDEKGLELVGKNFPEKIMFGAINWIFHMVSDMAGSSGSAMKDSLGTGLPGPLVSLVKELSSVPLFRKLDKSGEFSVYISKLFNGTLLGERDANNQLIPHKFDLRTELGVAHHMGRQAIPVIVNECIVRALYFVRRFATELSNTDLNSPQDIVKLNWNIIMPFRNRTVERMATIAAITFTVADTADAAIHAAIESGANWVLFSGRSTLLVTSRRVSCSSRRPLLPRLSFTTMLSKVLPLVEGSM